MDAKGYQRSRSCGPNAKQEPYLLYYCSHPVIIIIVIFFCLFKQPKKTPPLVSTSSSWQIIMYFVSLDIFTAT